MLTALVLGWGMLVLALIGHARQRGDLLAAALDGGLWLFLLPVAFTVSHRMIPFFSKLVIADYEAYQPRATLIAGVSAMLGYAIVSQLAPDVTWLFALALAAVAGWLSYSWRITRSFSVRLLAMLHIAFAWLAVAGVLFAVQGLTLLLSGAYILGRAPLHAAGIGFLASLVIAFASRVSLGHSGRSLKADRLTWHCFLGFQAVAVLRILADLPLAGVAWSYPLYTAAAVLWIAAATAWSAHYLPIYLSPRIDGRPG